MTSGNPCDGQDELDEPTTPEPEPEEPANPDYTTTRVYYRSADQWATTYIHFGVAGGAWTEVPGIEMAQVCDGWLRHDIDSEGRRVQVAFNDGGENWDSNNGANYQVTSESVTIEDGVLAEGDPCPTVTEPDTDNPDNADDTDSGQGSGDNPGTDSGVEGDDLQAGAGAGSGGAGDELADTGADLMAVLALSALSILLAGMGFMVRKGRLGRQSIR